MKKYDLVVYGSTGFTGKLVCKHVAEAYHGKGQFTWAMAGRSKTKLETARSELLKYNSGLADVDLIVADNANEESLHAMAACAAVVVSTVGPFAQYGRAVIKACVEDGAHYCDLSAETQHSRRIIDEFDAQARAEGVRIVLSCGLASVPTEVVTLLAADYMAATHKRQLGETVSSYTMNARGGKDSIDTSMVLLKALASDPGTFMLLEEMETDEKVQKVMQHPYCLTLAYNNDPSMLEELKELKDESSPAKAAWSDAGQCWTGPYALAEHNERVVRMSNYLMGWKYGKQMLFSDRAGCGKEAAIKHEKEFAEFEPMIGRAAESPAYLEEISARPSEAIMYNGSFQVDLWALSSDPEASPEGGNGSKNNGSAHEPVRVHASIADMHRDPTYWSTTRMVLECALCMIPQNKELLAQDPYASICPAGVLSPSAAFGLVLHDRLTAAGYELKVGNAVGTQ